MDIPPIEQQIKRDGGARAETTAWGSVEWLVREDDPAGAEQTLALATWAPGRGNAEHTHPNCEEIVYVLEGAIDHTLGDQLARLEAGDLIVVPRDVPHRLANNSAAAVRTLIDSRRRTASSCRRRSATTRGSGAGVTAFDVRCASHQRAGRSATNATLLSPWGGRRARARRRSG